MDCNAVRDLLPDFALGALPSDEAAAVRAHLAECDAHAEAVELRAAALTLAASAAERDPPAGARDRLMAALSEETSRAAGAEAALGRSERRRPWYRRPVWQAGPIAAVLAFAVVGLVIWNVVLQVGDEADTSLSRFEATVEGVAGTALQIAGDDRVVLEFSGLPALPADQEYQVWLLGDGDAEGAGTFRASSSGSASVVVIAGDAGAIAVTVEPAGGSPLPTSEPILVADL